MILQYVVSLFERQNKVDLVLSLPSLMVAGILFSIKVALNIIVV